MVLWDLMWEAEHSQRKKRAARSEERGVEAVSL